MQSGQGDGLSQAGRLSTGTHKQVWGDPSSGEWILIIDLSHLEGGSVNDGTSEERSSLSYVTIQDAGVARSGVGRGRGGGC
jgi:hypothetical protein